jgi:hypothetical protein
MSTDPARQRAWQLFGCRDLDAIFRGAPKTLLPWPRLPRSKHGPSAPSAAHVLSEPPALAEVDPRELWATQPWVIRHHAAYYLTGEWERTGRTSADQHAIANRYPLVLADPRGRLTILTGHHRSLAALIEGRPVTVRVAPKHADTSVAVLPLLTIDRRSTIDDANDADPAAVAELIRAGHRVHVPSLTSASAVLHALGLDPTEIRDRLTVASGRAGEASLNEEI